MRKPLSPQAVEARRKNAQKSTGPRTEAGKRRVALNALKGGSYAQSLWDTMVALGEDPEEFTRLLQDLIASHQPGSPAEMMLVEDIATLRWQRRRAERARGGKLVRELGLLEQERHRRALEVGRDSYNASQAEILETGLRRAKDSPAKFEELLSYMEMLVKQVETRDFSEDPEPLLRAIYGKDSTLRGAQIVNLFQRFASASGGPTDKIGTTARPGSARASGAQGSTASRDRSPFNPAAFQKASTAHPSDLSPDEVLEEDLYTGLHRALLEETRDVMEEYQFYLREHVEISPAMRDACLAPTQDGWALMIRQEDAIDRQIERKTKLLMQMQKANKSQESEEKEKVPRSKRLLNAGTKLGCN